MNPEVPFVDANVSLIRFECCPRNGSDIDPSAAMIEACLAGPSLADPKGTAPVRYTAKQVTDFVGLSSVAVTPGTPSSKLAHGHLSVSLHPLTLSAASHSYQRPYCPPVM
jgi:hypothetical protein